MGTHNSFSSSFGRAWEGIQVCYFLHCRSLHFLYIPSGCEQHEQIKDHSYFLLDSFLVSISRSRHHFATLWDPDFANGLVKVETSNISISTSLTPTDGCFWKRSIRSASISGNFNRQILEKSHLIWDMALCTQKISRCHRRSQEHLTRLIELERSQIHSADSFTQAAWWVWWVGGCTTFWAHKMLGIWCPSSHCVPLFGGDVVSLF